jgi:hypothetical protein
LLDKARLRLGDSSLFVRKRRSTLLITPLAQHFMGDMHGGATGLPMGLQSGDQA